MVAIKRIGLRDVAAMDTGQTVWDGVVKGFAARRQKGTAVTYLLCYRNQEGRQRWFTIGRHGSPWTPDEARNEAKRLLGEVVKGGDPSASKAAHREAMMVTELCDLYMADARAGRTLKRDGRAKKASTLAVDVGRIERHIKPLLGRRSVASVTRQDIDGLLHDIAEGKSKASIKTKARGLALVRGGKTAANRCVGLLGAIFGYAVRKGLRTDNPVYGTQRFADIRRDRRLSDEEYQTLGNGLRQASQQLWPSAVAATQFMALSGWRRGEVLGLTWSDIDFGRRTATLADTKTGRSMRPLSRAACDLLRSQARTSVLVFPATKGDGMMAGYRKFWLKIAALAGLPADVTPHVLRHSFASLAADLGYSESTIASLIGHLGRSSTSRYLHSADAVLLAAADKASWETLRLMGIEAVSAVIKLRSTDAYS